MIKHLKKKEKKREHRPPPPPTKKKFVVNVVFVNSSGIIFLLKPNEALSFGTTGSQAPSSSLMDSLYQTATFESSPQMEKFLCDRLLDPAQTISERFRSLFSLRNLKGPGPRNALILGSCILPLVPFSILL